MSKTAMRKLHWRSRMQDTFVPLIDSSGELGVAVGGGADYGEFPFVTAAPGDGINVGDIILEIGGTPVLGMTLGDVRGVLNSCPHPVRIKTVSPGATLCKDLRLYLSKCFTPGSVDSTLQQVIRENLFLRAVPCTTRPPRAGEIPGTDYNFVSIEEFFSLEGSGALLESGKFKGNYYGTPRPVHISAETPPITYQEHRSLLRNFRTRSKSLSNLEKAAAQAEYGDENLGLPGGHRSPLGRRASSGGFAGVLENGFMGNRAVDGGRGMIADDWEQAFSDPGECHYIEHKRTSWQSPRAPSRESLYKNKWFTEYPEELQGFLVRTHLIKGARGFGFNIVGGSKPRQFLQVYSVTSIGPSALKTADILVYINDVCMLGVSHKKAVEMLKSVPVGHGVDIAIRRGYPMLYNPDGCPIERLPDSDDAFLLPTTSQPEPLHHLPRRPTPTPQIRHLNGLHGDYVEPGVILDANGNATSFASRQSSLRRSSLSNAASPPLTRPLRSLRTLAQVQSLDPTLASQSDSEVVSAIGSHRASMIRNHNNNSLSNPQHHLRYGTSIKSSESDLSTCTLPVSRLPLPLSPKRPSSSPGGPRSAHARLFRPQPSHLRPPPMPESPRHRGFNGLHGNHSPMASPNKMARAGGGFGGGELVPVALAQTEADKGLGFSMMGGGPGGGMTVVRRVWDRKQCNTLQPGDAIVKINGADVQSLSLAQVQTVLQEHTKQGEVTLLVYRGGIYQSIISPSSLRRLPPPLLRPPPPPGGSVDTSILTDALPVPRTSFGTPPSTAPTSSSLIQSTSFLESIPVTLTMEPKDWISTGLEDDAGRVTEPDSGLEIREDERVRPLRGFDVELKRKPGEGFGFVIASQDLENTKAASLLPHRFVTVRRGSPAAKSGQIRPGDRLEAVEGRSVVTLPHRELAQILRRAGNTLRLTVVPRPSTYSTSLSEPAESELGHRSRKGQRSRPKRDSRYYSVNLDRGPSGFGFSLRGGSEYNMGLYVLGLMEGGPASRSQKIQVSDQLVEINGDSTAGMTHSQAVEQIRRGGHRIHLVLKRGNGYVPDYGREHRITSPSRLRQPKEQGMAAVDSSRQRGRRSKQKRRDKSLDGREKGTSRRRRWQSESRSVLRSPDSEPEKGESSRKRTSRSLPREALSTDDDHARRVRKGERVRSRERKEKKRVTAPVEENLEEKVEEGKEVLDRAEVLPIPSPHKKLPRPKQEHEEESDEMWKVAAGYHAMKQLQGYVDDDDDDHADDIHQFEEKLRDFEEDEVSWDAQEGLLSNDTGTYSVPQRKPFSFLASALSVNQLRDDETESGGSRSDDSMSAASISSFPVQAIGRRAAVLPGPWLAPGRHRVARDAAENGPSSQPTVPAGREE
ncbi:membrane-associated guanylate kinase, WW and PDZ domain-containing protein 1 isoform X2 [Hippocampus zosterae]|nr:membrane-associated guanylate kinase, WW and PDZ domain-containing protein 1 isoform X2 [Hippocampus zosterae]